MTTTTEMIARQQPLTTAFGYRTTAAEVIADHELRGRTALVTGGYSGLGLETVKALSGAGVRVIVPARRVDVARAALDGVAGVEVAAMDLGDLDSVAAFTAGVRETGAPIDLVINVAGIMATPENRTPQGWESQFGTNHLGHFALVGGVASLLSEGARVVSYSSVGHYRSPVQFEDINFESTPYDPWVSYGQAKTANALFAVGLDARAAGRGMHAYSVHPGGIMTDLQRHVPREELVQRGWVDADGTPNPLFKTPAQGAATGLWAATAPELSTRGGVYAEDSSLKGVVPDDHVDATTGGVKEWAIDTAAADRLWELSVTATGLDPFGGA
jgi:NAD(P)-dependent dehydrogenase (short-subunit alcohol dehydrogenase family)